MRPFFAMRRFSALGMLALLGAPAAAQSPEAAATLPDFSATADTAWVGIGIGAFFPVEGQPAPVAQHADYPYVSNADYQRTGQLPTQRVGDPDNPNLRDWAREEMRRENEEVIAGKFAYTSRAACRSAGVPGFDVLLSGALFILQSEDKVTLVFDGNAEMRHIWLDVGHSENLRPTGYGESVGHYEGDTLVVDTIGMTDDTYLDNWRTPHSDKLHVTERWRLVENGEQLEILITIEDPETFYRPFTVQRLYERVNRDFIENICAEDAKYVTVDYGIPVATREDF